VGNRPLNWKAEDEWRVKAGVFVGYTPTVCIWV
jgi:hypothetical protein